MAKAKLYGDWVPESEKGNIAIMCPGCNAHHVLATVKPQNNGALWGFNGDMEKPTFNPSLLIRSVENIPPVTSENIEQWREKPWEQTRVDTVCHSFIIDGMIQFLGDCTHHLANQTVELPNI